MTVRRFFWTSLEVGWIGNCGWLVGCLTLLTLHGVLFVSPWSYYLLLQEDGLVENLTVVVWLLAGVLLFAAAWVERRRFPRFVFVVGGVVMTFIAGEEISWGQRILGFATPDFLSHNTQGEFNVHNLPDGQLLSNIFSKFMMLICLMAAAAHVSRKRDVLGVPLPSLPLLLMLLSTFGFARIGLKYLADDADLTFWIEYLSRWQMAVLVLLAAWGLFSKRTTLLLAVIATATLCLACLHIRRSSDSDFVWSSQEATEWLFGLFCLCCAGELLHGLRHRVARAAPLPPSVRENGGRGPIWPAVSWLTLAGVAGLLTLVHFKVRMDHPAVESALQVVRSDNPDIRAEFDLYLSDGRLIYHKEPCDQADVYAAFLLHIVPKDEADLPGHRRRDGFDKLNFDYRHHPASIRDSCVIIASLPDYPIAAIRTGQYNSELRLWDAELLVAE